MYDDPGRDDCAVNELFAIQRPSVPDPEASAEEAAPVKVS